MWDLDNIFFKEKLHLLYQECLLAHNAFQILGAFKNKNNSFLKTSPFIKQTIWISCLTVSILAISRLFDKSNNHLQFLCNWEHNMSLFEKKDCTEISFLFKKLNKNWEDKNFIKYRNNIIAHKDLNFDSSLTLDYFGSFYEIIEDLFYIHWKIYQQFYNNRVITTKYFSSHKQNYIWGGIWKELKTYE